MELNLSEVLAVALEAASAGAEAIAKGYYDRDLTVRHKGLIDLVTQYDLKSEKIVRDIIRAHYPEHEVLAEEEGLSAANPRAPRWYVDPLDGTTNFVHRHPFFAVSLALAIPDEKGRLSPLVGVVHAPILRECYYAVRGGGAYIRNPDRLSGEIDQKLQVSLIKKPVDALVNTGFPYDVQSRAEEIMEPLGRVIKKFQAVRRAGAASLDLAFVAAGRAEGYWEAGLKPWDVAAGMLLVTEAGGRISDYQVRDYVLEKSQGLLASNSLIHDVLAGLLAGSNKIRT
ncbi:MAG: inositol monophosphatase [Deltaproteobacteria bacterium]|jgi:myo-inositol-1(or 4)-monophosphatase|nr:inositol monophosphatase [Deltaproteobacteria bacterium]